MVQRCVRMRAQIVGGRERLLAQGIQACDARRGARHPMQAHERDARHVLSAGARSDVSQHSHGGPVRIDRGGVGDITFIGSTLTNITVSAHS
jgi:hypothetical protein